jgi:hypothetical protein
MLIGSTPIVKGVSIALVDAKASKISRDVLVGCDYEKPLAIYPGRGRVGIWWSDLRLDGCVRLNGSMARGLQGRPQDKGRLGAFADSWRSMGSYHVAMSSTGEAHSSAFWRGRKVSFCR